MRSMLTIEQQQKPPRFSPQPTNGGGLLLSPIGAGRETWLLDTEWNQEAGDADRGSQRRGESTSMRPRIHQQIPYRGPGGDASERSGSRCRQRTGRTYRTRGPIEVD